MAGGATNARGPGGRHAHAARSGHRPRLSDLPGIRLARTYELAWLGRDVTAGLALTGILVPAGMAYADASGLPPIIGLYATIVPLLVYALLGPSRLLMLGPDSSLVPLVLVALAPFAAMEPSQAVPAAALLAILVGLVTVAGGLARLGFLTDLLSAPTRTGFMAGIALIIVASQLPRLFGFSIPGSEPVPRFSQFIAAVRDGQTNVVALAIGVACLATILGLRRIRPGFPGVLIAVVGATIVSAVLDLATRSGIAVVGPLPQGLPAFAPPPVNASSIITLLPAAVGIALVTAADTTILSRTFASRHGYTADPNHELLALGAANLATGFFTGYPISSSASRTAVAESAGTRTQVTGIVGALAIVVLLVAAPGLLAALPQSALAAVVLAAAAHIADVGAFRTIWDKRRSEFGLAVITFLGVVVVGVIQGIFLAVILSLLLFLRHAWWPHDAILGRATGVKGYHDLSFYPDAKQIPGLVLYRFDAPLLFFNASAFRERVLEQVDGAAPRARWVVIAAEPITDVDTTAAEAIELLLTDLRLRGVTLAFAELKDPVKVRLRRYGTMARIGEERCYPTIGTAVDGYIASTGEAWVDWEDAATATTPPGPGAA
ncbi:MAG: sulfate permease [Chloroflexota bacterium]